MASSDPLLLTPSDPPLRLEIARTPAAVWSARLFSAAVARHLGYLDETVEDIKLAVSEAVTSTLGATSKGSVAISIEPGQLFVNFHVSSPSRAEHPEGEVAERMALALIESMFPGAQMVTMGDGRSAMHFRAERPPYKPAE